MRNYTSLILIFISSYCSAQHFEFSHDAAGNRTQRKYYVMRLANPALEADSSSIIEKKHGISVFPNPTPDKINVSISSLENGEAANVYLSDEQGKVLLIWKQTIKHETFDLSIFMAGIYYIKIYLKSESVYYKIVKL